MTSPLTRLRPAAQPWSWSVFGSVVCSYRDPVSHLDGLSPGAFGCAAARTFAGASAASASLQNLAAGRSEDASAVGAASISATRTRTADATRHRRYRLQALRVSLSNMPRGQ